MFALPGVVQVWVAGDRVTVACAEPQPWEIAAKTIAKAIRAAYPTAGVRPWSKHLYSLGI
jgi:phage tail sheath gpL-like